MVTIKCICNCIYGVHESNYYTFTYNHKIMKTYCSKCGSANEYTMVKPKFCNNCASPFEVITAAQKESKGFDSPIRPNKKNTRPVREVDRNDSDDDGENIDFFDASSIDKLDITILNHQINKTQKLENILANPTPPKPRTYVRGEEPDTAQFLAEIQRAAGAGQARKKE